MNEDVENGVARAGGKLDGPTPDVIRAREAAQGLHQEYCVQKPEDIRVEDIAMDRNILVLEGELHGAEARLLRDGSRGLMRIRADIAEPGRKRFAISHELGHWHLHERGSYVCTASDMADYQKSAREVEANAFAAELLMPSFLFWPLCAGRTPSLNLVEELKIRFNTTLTATAFRVMDETNANCVVVLTKNGVVERCRLSGDCKLPLQVQLGLPLPKQSIAFGCQPNPPGIPKPERVPLETWFDPARFGPDAAKRMIVWEQSMRLGPYPTVLTMIRVERS